MPIKDESFRRLRAELILATIIGTVQKRQLVFQDKLRPELKVYMYKEPNHKRSHVHIYFGNEEATSICITTREILAENMSGKLIKPLISWISEYEADLQRVWDEIQLGNKPELLWTQSA